MVLRYFLMMCCVAMLAGCPHSQAPMTKVATQSSQQIRQVPAFTRVYVKGLLNVSLHTGFPQPHVVLHGDPRDLAYVVTKVVNGLLQVSLGAGYPRYGAVQVEVDSRYLNSIEYHGMGTVSGTQLHTGLLEVLIDNKGKTTLQGQIGLRKLNVRGGGYTEISSIDSPYLLVNISDKSIVRLSGKVNLAALDMNGTGRLSLYWVKSKELTIRGRGKAFIQLAGVVDKLNVELWETARFNGRYLRAQRAFVKTHNRSVAEISAVKRQHTLATDTSDIHFYNIPAMKADFMSYDGAVLDMRDLGLPFIQEYNQYNQ